MPGFLSFQADLAFTEGSRTPGEVLSPRRVENLAWARPLEDWIRPPMTQALS